MQARMPDAGALAELGCLDLNKGWSPALAGAAMAGILGSRTAAGGALRTSTRAASLAWAPGSVQLHDDLSL